MTGTSAPFPFLFSDVDETIIFGKSLLEFGAALRRTASATEASRLDATLNDIAAAMTAGMPRGELNRSYYASVIGGLSVERVHRVALDWYRARESKGDGFFKAGVTRFISEARDAGTKLVLVSGSFLALVEPIAKRLAASELLITPLERVDDHYTGSFPGPPLIGEGKAIAIRAYAQRHGLDLAQCAGIGDDVTDIPFLSLLGHPHVPSDGSPEVLRHAAAAGWTVVKV
jgi:HAD superfamily hydrolase (TIGR01490 family)